MSHVLTDHYEQVIDQLIKSGRFANRSEVVRAGLKALEEKYLEDYLHPTPLKPGVLERIYRKQGREEQDEELAAVRLSHRPGKNGRE